MHNRRHRLSGGSFGGGAVERSSSAHAASASPVLPPIIVQRSNYSSSSTGARIVASAGLCRNVVDDVMDGDSDDEQKTVSFRRFAVVFCFVFVLLVFDCCLLDVNLRMELTM